MARATQAGRNLRIFGEMVALLWAEGNRTATIRVEELWNELGKGHSFSIFCAYPIHGFRGEANGQTLMHVCQEHSRVIPAESFGTGTNLDERLRTIILLQQKAISLEAEIAERKRAESATRAEQAKLAMAAMWPPSASGNWTAKRTGSPARSIARPISVWHRMSRSPTKHSFN